MSILDLQLRIGTGEPFRISYVTDDVSTIGVARDCPGATMSKDKISYPLDASVVEWFDANLGGRFEVSPALLEWVVRYKSTRKAIDRLTGAKYERVTIDLPYADKLYDYQTVGVAWLVEKKRGILADEPGLGKTIQSLAAADLCGAKRILILTVNQTVQEQWEATIRRWNLGSSTLVLGTKTARLAAMKSSVRWYIAPSTILSSKDVAIKNWLKQRFDCIIIDEAHMMQSKDSARGAMAGKLKSEYMFLLTGTPIWNKLLSLWNLLHIVDRARWSSYWLWIDRYFQCWLSPFGKQVGNPRTSMEGALRAEIGEVLLRRELLEVRKDFPVATEHVIELELPDAYRAEYKKIRSAIRDYQDVTVCGRTYEITSGVQAIPILRAYCNQPEWVRGSSGSTRTSGDNPKCDKVVECVRQARERGLQCLVFTWHTAYADWLAEQLGAGARSTHGKKLQATRAEDISQFKAGKFDTLVASLASLGVGTDLPDVDVLIFAETDHTPAVIEQAWRRIYRISSVNEKLIIFIYYKKTIEETIFRCFTKKQALSDSILADTILME